MTPVKGSRPYAIKLFALAFLIAALASFAERMSNLELAQLDWTVRAPWFAWNRDWTIVASSAELSIALIPLTWIVVFASSFARWMVLAFSLLKLTDIVDLIHFWFVTGTFDPLSLIEPGLILIALIALFTPSASQWLTKRDSPLADVFE